MSHLLSVYSFTLLKCMPKPNLADNSTCIHCNPYPDGSLELDCFSLLEISDLKPWTTLSVLVLCLESLR